MPSNLDEPPRMMHAPYLLCFAALFAPGCLPDRVNNQIDLDGRPLMLTMQKIGGPLENLKLPEGGEGRVLNELQKLWHYMSVSSNTHLTLFRSRYSSAFTIQETVIAHFDHAGIGTIDVTALDEDTDAPNGVDSGHLKFTAEVQNPSPGTAKGEIFPFPRTIQNQILPPSIHMVLPPGFTVPTGSHLDPRKRYMRDDAAIAAIQSLIRELFRAGQRQVPLAD